MHNHGLHHWHKRKRIHEKHEPYPHPHPFKRFIDKMVYVMGIITPIMIIPQITKIWIHKNASGVSIIAWSMFLVNACFWLMYGTIHKAKPIIIMYTLFAVMNILVVIGTILYG